MTARLQFVFLLVGLAVVSSALGDGLSDVAAFAPGYYLEVDKSDRALRVKHGDQIYREFTVAHGRGGLGDKSRLGDNLTPEGIYRIVGFNENSKFHYFMRLNYPNVEDAFIGLKNKLISKAEFDQIIDALRFGKLPPQNTALGGAIGIHGVGEQTQKKLDIHHSLNWTEGCVALTNEEIQELRDYVSIGTEVVIKE